MVEIKNRNVKLGEQVLRATATVRNPSQEAKRQQVSVSIPGIGRLGGTALEVPAGGSKTFSVPVQFQNISGALDTREDFLQGAKEDLGIPSRRDQVGPFSRSDVQFSLGEPSGDLVSSDGSNNGSSSNGTQVRDKSGNNTGSSSDGTQVRDRSDNSSSDGSNPGGSTTGTQSSRLPIGGVGLLIVAAIGAVLFGGS